MIRVYIRLYERGVRIGPLPQVAVISGGDESMMEFGFHKTKTSYVEILTYTHGSYLAIFDEYFVWW